MNDLERNPFRETGSQMATANLNAGVIATYSSPLAGRLFEELRRLQTDWNWQLLDPAKPLSPDAADVYFLIPPTARRDGMIPDLHQSYEILGKLGCRLKKRLLLLSSALVYGTGPNRQGFVSEAYLPHRNGEHGISEAWVSLEELFVERVGGENLTILRPTIAWQWPILITRLLSRRFVSSLPGHDPNLQFLSLSDLAGAVVCALQAEKPGIFNVAPDGAIPLHAAIREVGGVRTPIPRTLRRMIHGGGSLDFLRYPWTIANKRMKNELGYAPQKSNLDAVRELANQSAQLKNAEPQFDGFGMDKKYIDFYGRTLFRFLSDVYWRIEDKGLEHVPKSGTGVLVGMHRGFMPWDGVMALHTVVRRTGRYPRFLTHPGLLKFPYLANFMTKLGGVIACQESAEHVLNSGELLGIFPEGIHGAFTPYRQAYTLKAFGRDAFVKLALRHRAPIIPFVTVGSAEIYPIYAKIKSRRWTGYTDWPFIPITATFPFLPFPLPSKWHTEFLPPISTERYGPEAADDRAVVKAISLEVRARMQEAVDAMLARRRSIFFGSIFEQSREEGRSKTVAA